MRRKSSNGQTSNNTNNRIVYSIQQYTKIYTRAHIFKVVICTYITYRIIRTSQPHLRFSNCHNTHCFSFDSSVTSHANFIYAYNFFTLKTRSKLVKKKKQNDKNNNLELFFSSTKLTDINNNFFALERDFG